MAETIDTEAGKATQLVTDLDKQRRSYVIKTGGVKVHFVAPLIFNYERFFFYLLRNSTYIKLDKKYFQRPDYLSYDQYDTVTLWPLLLFVNRVQCIEDFFGPKVYIPNYSTVLEVSKYNQDLLDPLDVDVINAPNANVKKLQVYYSKVRIPTAAEQPITPDTKDTQLPSYLRQTFTINQMNLLNKYIDLGFVPVQETVESRIVDDNLVLVYNAHFTIVKDVNDEYKRFSWAAADCTLGPGLENILEVGSVLEVTYVMED